MLAPARLGPAERAAGWAGLADAEYDVVVVGGGVTGAGVALDAATRGLRVLLVEQRDLASGTSSRSSKLFHGGLRYLEQLNFSLVREALRERELMLTRLAPHLVKPVSFLYPLRHRRLGAALRDGRADPVRPDGRGALGARPPAAQPAQGAGDGARAAQGRAGRGPALLRRAGRRRPAHDDARPHRGDVRRDGAQLGPGDRPAARGGAGGRRAT